MKWIWLVTLVLSFFDVASARGKESDFSISSAINIGVEEGVMRRDLTNRGINSEECFVSGTKQLSSDAFLSIDTKHTIMKVRSAKVASKDYIVASSYEGIVMFVGYDGVIQWENNIGNGIMNHDLWCDDLDGDGADEILVANANGALYCLDYNGKERWTFKPGPTPMYAVTTIAKNGVNYVVCGGYDLSYYYLNAEGEQVKEIKS